MDDVWQRIRLCPGIVVESNGEADEFCLGIALAPHYFLTALTEWEHQVQ